MASALKVLEAQKIVIARREATMKIPAGNLRKSAGELAMA
jgi:hypothetical protein